MNQAIYPPLEAAKLGGFETVAMIDYLERQGVFRSETKRGKRRGKKRYYTFRDLVVLRTISTLLKHGASVLALKKALNEFQNSKTKMERANLADSGGGALRYFVISGGRIYFKSKVDELVDLASNGQLAFSFMIDLEDIHRSLRENPLVLAKVERRAVV